MEKFLAKQANADNVKIETNKKTAKKTAKKTSTLFDQLVKNLSNNKEKISNNFAKIDKKNNNIVDKKNVKTQKVSLFDRLKISNNKDVKNNISNTKKQPDLFGKELSKKDSSVFAKTTLLSKKIETKILKDDKKQEFKNDSDNIKVNIELNKDKKRNKTKLIKKEKNKNSFFDKLKTELDKKPNKNNKQKEFIIKTDIKSLEKDINLNSLDSSKNKEIADIKHLELENINTNNTKKKKNSNSLLDRLAKKNIKIDKNITNDKAQKRITKDKILNSKDKLNLITQKEIVINKAKKNIQNKQTPKEIVKTAQSLNLNIKDLKIKKDKISDKIDTQISKDLDTKIDNKEQVANLNKSFLSQHLKTSLNTHLNTNIKQSDIKDDKEIKNIINKKDIDDIKDDIKKIDEEVVRVEKTLSEQIQAKAISARQNINRFMSDLARSIYANYKPPRTAFRIKLEPTNLGEISILIRAKAIESRQGLDISLSIQNQKTYDVISDNRSLLYNSLTNRFSNSEVSLNLSSGQSGEFEEGSKEEYQQQNKQQNKQQKDSDKKSQNNETYA